MNLSKMPIGVAYLVAPALLLAIAGMTIARSESPLLLAVIVVACGLLCAAALHAYVFVRRKLTRNEDENP